MSKQDSAYTHVIKSAHRNVEEIAPETWCGHKPVKEFVLLADSAFLALIERETAIKVCPECLSAMVAAIRQYNEK